ncbi:MAG TPA: GNAT family N-acetyltransferase [Phycisphaerae bacterium]|nr:GNAT family N-acetyltransferase [Phycisphaerales bacterium]HRX83481.1 GNAT family N-acetyltransferase [Phycisphaerae bacterium]
MSASAPQPQIDVVDATALAELHALAQAALPLDRFSRDLLAEKLFANPQPDITSYRTYAARAEGRLVGFMQSVVNPAERRGWIGMFAVADGVRRRGVATALLERALGELRLLGADEVEVLAIPGNYFTPGLDPRYTEALCFLERRGFTRFKDCANLEADLSAPFPTEADEQRLAAAGVTIRRAARDDDKRLDAFFDEAFGAGWRLESELAMRNDPPALHLALRGERVIAFSGHSSQNREWGFFGPMGTLPETRGLGIGRVLLRHCLNDLRAAGHRTSIIPWVGPIAFYAYHADCRVTRVFWRYRWRRDGSAA